MKPLAAIIALLVLTLNCIPCLDDVCAVKNEKVKADPIQQQNDRENKDQDDSCSPFCHCTCCAGFSINQFFTAASILMFVDGKSYTSYLPGNLIDYSSPIWQPPQLKV